MIRFIDHRVFRNTPAVRFLDITVPGSNGIDLVEHGSQAVSPPPLKGAKQWYVHQHQTDYNRVIRGERLFELFFREWTAQHWYVYLDRESGALEIPPGCYHRSLSGKDGSLLLNHAVRTPGYDEKQEFLPKIIHGPESVAAHYHGITPADCERFIANTPFR